MTVKKSEKVCALAELARNAVRATEVKNGFIKLFESRRMLCKYRQLLALFLVSF